MLSGHHRVTIARPAGEVFDHIANGAMNSTWRGSVVETSLLSGDGREGSVWHQVVKGPGRFTADADYRVTVYDRPHRFAFDVIAGPSRGTGVYTLVEDSPATTTVTLEMSLTPHGVMRILNGLIPRQMSIELDNLDRLRVLLS